MPVAWTFKGESGKSFVDTPVTLESQGVSSATVSFKSLEADILTLEYQVADYAASSTLPELRQTISLYRDSDRFFYGNVIRVSPKVDATSSTVIVEVAGPWWWLDRIPMTSVQVDGEGNLATRPMSVFGTFLAGDNMANNLRDAIDRAVTLGAPMIRGSISAFFTVPRITLSQSTCGDVISELVRLIPDTMVYFDYSGTGFATINISRRADGSTPTRTVALGTDDVTALNIQPLIELEVAEVQIPYVDRATTGETQYTTQDSGTASTGKVEILPVSGPELVDFLPNDQLDTIKIANVYATDAAGLASAWKQKVYAGWADMAASLAADGHGADNTQYGLITASSGVTSSAGVNVFRNASSGSGGATTVAYSAGSHTFTQTSFPGSTSIVCFEDNQEPPQWAIDDYGLTKYFPHIIGWWDGNLTSGGTSTTTFVQERRNYILDVTNWSIGSASDLNTSIDAATSQYFVSIWWVDKKESVWLCPTANIPSDNVLIRAADFTFASPPSSFAANLLAAQNYVPHEGSIDLSSSDAGATRYRGTKVRVTGSLSTMTAMDAPVAGETLNIREGSTQVELGQPPRLDFLEFVNRIRRTPQDNTDYVASTPEVNLPATALAYVTAVEASDGYTFSTAQKVALAQFVNDSATLTADGSVTIANAMKFMYILTFNSACSLRNFYAPTELESWTTAPVFTDGAPADFSGGAQATLSWNPVGKGMYRYNIHLGAAMTGITASHMAIFAASGSGSATKAEMKIDGTKLAYRLGTSNNFNGIAGKTNGVFAGTRDGTAIKMGRCFGGSQGFQLESGAKGGGADVSNSMAIGTTSGHAMEGNISVFFGGLGMNADGIENVTKLVQTLAVALGHHDLNITSE